VSGCWSVERRTLSAEQIGELPKTLLGATRETDSSLLVAADSFQADYDGASQGTIAIEVEKLYPVAGLPVVWGYAGDVEYGESIRRYLAKSKAAPSNWEAFLADWSKLVQTSNQQESTSGITSFNKRAACLIAGFIGDESCMAAVSPDGIVQRKEDFLFLGAGRVAARVGYAAVGMADASTDVERRLLITFEACAATMIELRAPISLWRVMPSGCVHLCGPGLPHESVTG
jgi:hypothetical protein